MARNPRSSTKEKDNTPAAIIAGPDGSIYMTGSRVGTFAGVTLRLSDGDLVPDCRLYEVTTTDGSYTQAWGAATLLARSLADIGAGTEEAGYVQALAAHGMLWQELNPDADFAGVGLLVSHPFDDGTVLLDFADTPAAEPAEPAAEPPAKNVKAKTAQAAPDPNNLDDIDDLIDAEHLLYAEGSPDTDEATEWLRYHATLGLLLTQRFPEVVAEKTGALIEFLDSGDGSEALKNKKAVKFVNDFADKFNGNAELRNPVWTAADLGLPARTSRATLAEKNAELRKLALTMCVTGDVLDFVSSEAAAAWGVSPVDYVDDQEKIQDAPTGMDLDEDEAMTVTGLPPLDIGDAGDESVYVDAVRLAAAKVVNHPAFVADGTEDQASAIADCLVFGQYSGNDPIYGNDACGLSSHEVEDCVNASLAELDLSLDAFCTFIDTAENAELLVSAAADEVLNVQLEAS